MKHLLITIDTEGDNLWKWHHGDPITTENSRYLSRFQNLSNQYGFKPVWLTNWEMLQDERYISFISRVIKDNSGEIGMHLHAWNTPPEHNLSFAQQGAPYLIEYPFNIMDEKIKAITECIRTKTGVNPVSHRAGRWATNEAYFRLLIKHGYHVDCSVTPHVDWSTSPGRTEGAEGSDYSNSIETPHFIECGMDKPLLEVPVTIRKVHHILSDEKSFRGRMKALYHGIHGQNLWLRPNGRNLQKMKYLLRMIERSNDDYAMFMLHSSEMMPGGSPTFQTEEAIEKMYADTEELFRIASRSFSGTTLKEYESIWAHKTGA